MPSSLSGQFLVARHTLRDPNFCQTVVLLLQHGEEGAFGLVVNRPIKSEELPFPVFTGGPCESPGLLMLHGHNDWVEADPESGPVAPGIFLGDAECMNRITDPTPTTDYQYRMFSGYSGWGPGQLEGELSAGAWQVVPATGDILFDTPVESLWIHLAPPSLPEPSVN